MKTSTAVSAVIALSPVAPQAFASVIKGNETHITAVVGETDSNGTDSGFFRLGARLQYSADA